MPPSKKARKVAGVATVKSNLGGPKHANKASFKPGNKFALKPRDPETGEIDPRINLSGKSKHEDALLSRGLKVQLAARAPDAVALAAKLPVGSSWSQVLQQRILYEAAAGNMVARARTARVDRAEVWNDRQRRRCRRQRHRRQR